MISDGPRHWWSSRGFHTGQYHCILSFLVFCLRVDYIYLVFLFKDTNGVLHKFWKDLNSSEFVLYNMQ